MLRNSVISARRSLLIVGLLFVLCQASLSAAVTPEQRKKLKELDERTKQAGEMYAEGRFSDSADSIIGVQKELLEMLAGPKDRDLLRLAKPLFSRLDRAHGLLELEGAELPVLPSWTEVMKSEAMAEETPVTEGVSFKRDVAPWLISSCGNCHVTGRKGGFSMANYDALMGGVRGAKVVYAGDSKGSRLLEVIETGDMPPGNNKVPADKVAALKAWIDAGAKFDGPDPSAQLQSYAEKAGAPASQSPASNMATQMADGSESVSFAQQIAPVLVENCKGCHIAGRRASGNLRMDTFAQMMRGGASGELIAGTNANNSLLIKKLKGQEGQRMPAGRPALSDDTIALISTWIREGAKFDGPAPDTNISVVIDQAWAEGADHDELFAKRKEASLESWSQVLPNDKPSSAASDEAFVLGNVTQSRIDRTLEQVDEAIEVVRKQFRAPSREPLVRGGFSVFVLKSRYDYSEFGRMTENRELPKDWLGHWQADPVQVYAVLAGEEELDEEQAQAVAVQVIAGAYLGSFQGVPDWFAEGVARNLVIANYRRGDERIQQWQASLPAALQTVENAGMLLNNRLDEEAAGLVGAAITAPLLERTNRRRFDKLLELLQEGKSFDDAFTFAFGPPDKYVQAWLGKK